MQRTPRDLQCRRYNREQQHRKQRGITDVAQLFVIKIERVSDSGCHTEFHQSRSVAVTDEDGGRVVSWHDVETGEAARVLVSHDVDGGAEDGGSARVVYIENAAGNTTQVVRPRRE